MVDVSVIANGGKQLLGNRMDGSSANYIQYLGWSDDTGSPVATETTLAGEDSAVTGDPRILPTTQYYTNSSNKQSFVFTLTAGSGNAPGSLAKFGLFTAATGGILFSQTKLNAAIAKNSGKEVQIQIDIAIT